MEINPVTGLVSLTRSQSTRSDDTPSLADIDTESNTQDELGNLIHFVKEGDTCGGGGGMWLDTAKKTTTRNTTSPLTIRYSYIKTQTLHIKQFDITAMPQCWTLFSEKLHKKLGNTATPQTPIYPFLRSTGT